MMSHRPRYPGVLVLVVGPSGAGKDSLLDGARRHFGPDRRFRFVRRFITRPETAGGEGHVAVSEEEFAQLCAAGSFALAWDAHGLRYGIPADIGEDLARGRVVIANVSRTVVQAASLRFPTRVIDVTAAPEIRQQRLATRGRENAADIARRVDRAVAPIAGPHVQRVINDGALTDGIRVFVAAISRAAESAWPDETPDPGRTA